MVVIDRDAAANGASIRNFGFVTVTGQRAGDCWSLARRTRDIWVEVAEAAGIPVVHEGLVVTARRPESEAVIDAFLRTDMGQECRRLTPDEARKHIESLKTGAIGGALYSPHELRVESKTAVPGLARWLSEAMDVDFLWSTAVQAVCTPKIETSRGLIEAETVIVCPGDDFRSLFSARLAGYGLSRCKLHMLRIKPETSGGHRAALMSDLGLARYEGYAGLPEAEALQRRLDSEQPHHRQNGIHLIAVASQDGSLVVGDSHHYGDTPDPFADTRIERLILDELEAVLDLGPYSISETWLGTYASAPDRWRLTDSPDDATRIELVTSGCGASTCFGIAEETIRDLFGGE